MVVVFGVGVVVVVDGVVVIVVVVTFGVGSGQFVSSSPEGQLRYPSQTNSLRTHSLFDVARLQIIS